MDHDRTYSTYASRTRSRYATAPDPTPNDSGRRPPSKAPILVALAVLLVVAIVGTTYLVLQQLHDTTSATTAHNAPGATAPSAKATPDLMLPANNGWTSVTPIGYGDTQFSASNPQRGYLCGTSSDGNTHTFGATTDGGQTWRFSNSPASYRTCFLQVSPSNPLDVALTSINEPGDGQSAYIEAHYSTDGGQRWRAAPIPQKTIVPSSLLWSGIYLYVRFGNTLEVSDSGGVFTPITLSNILPGEPDIYLTSTVATAGRFYLNVQTKACQSSCGILLASSNGGASWSKIPNNGNVLLEQVVGNTFYGRVLDNQPFVTSVQRSTDGGASWQTITFPPLPGNANTSAYLVAPDQTIYTTSLAGVAALRNGAWVVLPVSTSDTDSIQVTGFSLDANGHIQKVWGHDDSYHAGVYWHSVAGSGITPLSPSSL